MSDTDTTARTPSKISHQRLGCYDFCHPKEKSESYRINFANGKVAEFTYKEEEAPCLEIDFVLDMPIDLIERLAGRESIKFLFSSSFDHFGEKTHEEKIRLCREWSDESDGIDLIEWSRRYMSESEKLKAKAASYEKTSAYLLEALKEKCASGGDKQ